MGEVKPGQFDPHGPVHVAPLVCWLASDDAKDVHGEVFRAGMSSVWMMKGWHSVAKVQQKGQVWDPVALGAKLKEELARQLTKKEEMADVMAEGRE
ncbi:MAG: hypothetical protein ACREP6_16335 [Candidatus Binataceae bacterium]